MTNVRKAKCRVTGRPKETQMLKRAIPDMSGTDFTAYFSATRFSEFSDLKATSAKKLSPEV